MRKIWSHHTNRHSLTIIILYQKEAANLQSLQQEKQDKHLDCLGSWVATLPKFIAIVSHLGTSNASKLINE